MSICPTCGGTYDKRFIDKPCPTCGKQYGRARMETVKMNVERAKKTLFIPDDYLGKEWSKSLLLEDKKADKNQALLNRTANIMEKIHESFAKGVVPAKSAIIIAPPNYSKVTWAFSCMQLAQAKGLTVAPLLDTLELNRFLILASEKPFHKLYGEIDFESYITSDVCFITVTKSYKATEAYKIILDVLDSRSRKGLPTFIISRFSMERLSKWDNEGHFRALLKTHFGENPKKLPVVCRYFTN